MSLGKTIVLGGMATLIAVHAHGLLACELQQHHATQPKPESVRKPAKVVEYDRVRIERRATSFTALIPSRRMILQ